jgi:hypothetical protein
MTHHFIEAEAEYLIANNSIPGLADLLPEQYGSLLNEQISGMEYGASLLTLLSRFQQSPKRFRQSVLFNMYV